jgi:hypothetical protein
MSRILSAIAVIAALVLPACAYASPATYLITFTTYDPSSPSQVFASGSYTITFDPTLDYENATAGLTVNSFNEFNPYFTPPASSVFTFEADSDILMIGGAPYGWAIQPKTNDYFLGIAFFRSSPQFSGFSASTPIDVTFPYAFGLDSLFDTGMGEVTVTPLATTSPVPEPSSLALLGTGLAGIFTATRRKFRRT